MAAVTVGTTTTTLTTGTTTSPVLVTNTASTQVFLQPGNRSLRQGQTVTFEPGTTVTATVTTGTGTVDVTATSPQVFPLGTWRLALADRHYNPARTMLISSSSGEGNGATAWDRGYYQVFRDRLRERFPVTGVTGGRGFLPAYVNHTTHPGPLTVTGGTTTMDPTQLLGFGLKSVNLSNATYNVTATFTGTGCDILYGQYTGGGTFTVTVDGGAPATVASTGATDRFKRYAVTGLTPGAHTVVIAWTTGGSVFIRGVYAYNGDENRGIHFYNGGKSSVTADTYATQLAQWSYAVTTVQPHLVILDIGRNEENAQMGSAFMRSRIEAIIAGVRANCATDPSFVQVLFPEVAGITGTRTEPHSAYDAAWRAIATNDPKVTLVDLTTVIPSPVTDNTPGLFLGDLTHPTDRGHSFIAENLLRVLGY